MMRLRLFIAAALLLLLARPSVAASSSKNCAICTIFVGLVEVMAQTNGYDIKTAADNLCIDATAQWLAPLCQDAVVNVIPTIQKDYDAKIVPDVTCRTMGMCTGFEQCTFYQNWPISPSVHEERLHAHKLATQGMRKGKSNGHGRLFESLAMWLHGPEETLRRAREAQNVQFKPIFDADQDAFSSLPTIRGSDWRGKDCNDNDANVYPGRSVDTAGPLADHNCNGIQGVAADGQSYEDKFCANSSQRGIIIFGDSATAHFRIPPAWLTAQEINAHTYDNLTLLVEDELDWPQCSWSTGHADMASCPPSAASFKSIYERVRERNLCNHRDFQNMGVNGATVSDIPPPTGQATQIHYRNGTDQPAIVFIAMIGNDVCGKHPTEPADFLASVTASLQFLDTVLAPGSHVLFFPIVDGRILYNTMHDLTHPLGEKYSTFYEYLMCLDISPCIGWMNTNETVRNATWERVQELNAVYPQVVADQKYSNFDMHYLELNFDTVVQQWVAAGGSARDVIEPVDGFHPSQTGNALFAESAWSLMESFGEAVIGPINPNNAAIQAMFGNQGGH